MTVFLKLGFMTSLSGSGGYILKDWKALKFVAINFFVCLFSQPWELRHAFLDEWLMQGLRNFTSFSINWSTLYWR